MIIVMITFASYLSCDRNDYIADVIVATLPCSDGSIGTDCYIERYKASLVAKGFN